MSNHWLLQNVQNFRVGFILITRPQFVKGKLDNASFEGFLLGQWAIEVQAKNYQWSLAKVRNDRSKRFLVLVSVLETAEIEMEIKLPKLNNMHANGQFKSGNIMTN